MISVHDFWRRLDNAREDGVLLLVLFKSWKRIADQVGRDGVDIASGIFNTLGTWATEGASGQSRLSMTVFGAYWAASPIGAGTARDRLAAWLPLGVSSRGLDLGLDCEVVSLIHLRTEKADELYRRACAKLQELVEAMPEEQRYPPLEATWDDVSGK
jgi:hypothetical protein